MSEKRDTSDSEKLDRIIIDYIDELIQAPPPESCEADDAPSESEVTPSYLAMPAKKNNNTLPDSVIQPATELMQPAPVGIMPLDRRPAILSESLLESIHVISEAGELEKTQESMPADTPTELGALAKSSDTDEGNKNKPVVDSVEQVDPVVQSELPLTISTDSNDDNVAQELDSLSEIIPWCENGRPHWAQTRFECLIFNVAGLKLAVPLITLGSIQEIDRKFNALPGQCNWFIGILQTPNSGNVKVLDTALCIMPDRYDPESRKALQYVISIHGCSWGLACHQLEKSVSLEPDQVKWRSQRGKRPWLAGTVVDYMCSLIDTDGFQELIAIAETDE